MSKPTTYYLGDQYYRNKIKGYWWFMYFPTYYSDSDFIMCLGKWKYGTSLMEILASDDFTDSLRKSVGEKDYDTFVVDTDLTQEWRKAEAIACKHFGTHDFTAEYENNVKTKSPAKELL